jgi:hypothetical protein
MFTVEFVIFHCGELVARDKISEDAQKSLWAACELPTGWRRYWSGSWTFQQSLLSQSDV